MDNPWDQLTVAVASARDLKFAVEQHAQSMASLLSGNLRKVSHWSLVALKRELASYDCRRKRWSK